MNIPTLFVFNTYGDLNNDVSIFRLVLVGRKRLQSFQFTFPLVYIQWFMNLVFIVPVLRLHHFQHVPHYYYCGISLPDSQGSLLIGILTNQWPMTAIEGIYHYISYFIKKSKRPAALQNRDKTNQSDLTVVHRIIVIIACLLILALHNTVLCMNYIATGHVNAIDYHIGSSTCTFSLSMLPLMLACVTPQFRGFFTAAWRITRRIRLGTQVAAVAS